MADENKKLLARCKIERALGQIEGVAFGLEQDAADLLEGAVAEIDDALGEVFADG